MVGRCFALATICLLFLYSSELAPTSLRARSLACCCSVGAAGSLIAPLLTKIAPHLPFTPLAVQGLLALLAAVLVPALPDTDDRPMPDSVEEAEMMATPKKPLNASSDSLDVGYGKCPEFVLVDGLIVSKECPSSSWEGSSDSGRGATEYSVTESGGEDSTSHGGTISTLRSSGRTQLLGWGAENPSLLSQFKPTCTDPPSSQFKSMEGSKMSSLEVGSLSDSWKQTKAEGRGEDRLLPLFSLSNGSKFGSNGSTSSRTNLVSQVQLFSQRLNPN